MPIDKPVVGPTSGIDFAKHAERMRDQDEAPYVCPGCYAIGDERCAPNCIDAEIERERQDSYDRGEGDWNADDDDLCTPTQGEP